MEYFQSALTGEKKKQKKIPLLVAGADSRIINELAALWLDAQDLAKSRGALNQAEIETLKQKIREAKSRLGKHRVAVLILKEIRLQLETFQEFAERIGRREIAQKFKMLLSIIDTAIKQKNISKQEEQSNETGDVFLAIKKALKEF